MKVKIRENSPFGKLASKKLKAKSVAIVFGNTIHLWGASKEEFLKNPYWVRHELEHINQYKNYGFFNFIFLYLLETFKRGYYKNKFEELARNKEKESLNLNEIEFI